MEGHTHCLYQQVQADAGHSTDLQADEGPSLQAHGRFLSLSLGAVLSRTIAVLTMELKKFQEINLLNKS